MLRRIPKLVNPDLGLRSGYVRGFLHQLGAQLRTLGVEPPSATEGRPADLSDLFEAELLLLQNMPAARLPAFVHGLRYRFEAARGVSMPDPKPEVSDEGLRQHLIECLNEMYRELQSRRSKDYSLSTHIRHVAHIGLCAIAVLFLILFIGDHVPKDFLIPPLAFILAAGGFGAIIGYLRDVLKPRGKHDLTILTFELESTRHYWMYRVLAGLLYSLVITLVAASGVLETQVFPQLVPEGAKGLSGVFMDRTMPTSEYTKLIVWCFVAGWFQPFVPGILDRLAARASDGEGAKSR